MTSSIPAPSPGRTSPLNDWLQLQRGSWQVINGMLILASTPQDDLHLHQIGLADLSCLARFGVKGAGAMPWLAQQGIPVPDRPNTWCSLAADALVARLGLNEFLIEDSLHATLAPQLAQACQVPPPQVYPVLRQDAAIALWGPCSNDLLRQTCNINFQALKLVDRPVVLTSMVGVAVTVIATERAGIPFYRIWCDGTFGHYLGQTLLTIAEELGGGVVGTARLIGGEYFGGDV